MAAAILSALLLSAPAALEDQWRTAELLRDGDLVVRLQVKRQATLADTEWLALEFENAGPQPLVVANAHYTINCERHDLKTGQRVSSGSLASGNTFDLFPDAWKTTPVAPIVLEAGKVYRIAQQSSNYSTALLGRAPPDGLRVRASAMLWLTLSGNRHLRPPERGVAFEFDWLPPDAAGLRSLGDRLHKMLATPQRRVEHGYLLNVLLDIPEVAETVTRDELLAALARRANAGDGRPSVARSLAKRFSDDPKVIAFVHERLEAGDSAAVLDVSHGGVWHPSFTEIVLRLYETNPGKYGGAFSALDVHRANWAKDVKVAERLAAVVRRLHPILNMPVAKLREDQLQSWVGASKTLARTGDRAAIEVLRPALDDSREFRNLSATALPGLTPPRLCDHAAEAILTLLGADEAQAIRMAAADGPAGRIARIEHWDRLIAELKKRLAAGDRPAR